jgi:hypothetical protein
MANPTNRSRRYFGVLLFSAGGVVGLQLLGTMLKRLLAGLRISDFVVAFQSACVAVRDGRGQERHTDC